MDGATKVGPMKRLAAGGSALALLGGFFVGFQALSAGAAGKVEPVLSYPPDQTAVTSGTEGVTFGGQVDARYTRVVNAYLRFENADGSPAAVFATPPIDKTRNTTDRVSVSNGVISGTTSIPPLPNDEAIEGGHVFFGLTVQDPSNPADTAFAESAQGLLIDIRDPYIKGTALIDPRTIKVLFSEPVTVPAGASENNVADWSIGPVGDTHPPLSVSGSGDTRILTLAPVHAKDQDATPNVRYSATALVGKRYHDGARISLDGPNTHTSCDLIPPVQPVIESVAGVAGKSALSNDGTPSISLTGLRPDAHYGQVFVETNGEAGFQFGGDAQAGEALANAQGKATVQLADLGGDGTYTLYGVARDQATCNFDTGTEEPPNHSTADLGSYTLDTVAPTALYALYDGSTIEVKVTEAIKGTDRTQDWVHPAIVESVSNPNAPEPSDQRFLTTTPGIPVATESLLTYTGAGDYTDLAGNKLETFDKKIVDGVPPIVSITTPAVSPVYTNQNAVTIAGTVQASDKVRLYRAPNDHPGAFEREHNVTSGTYEFAGVPLNANANNDFNIRSVKTGVPEVPSNLATVRVVQDNQAPDLSIQAPQTGEIFHGGESVIIRWTADDVGLAGLTAFPITLQYTTDGGATWPLISSAELDDGQYAWQVPEVNSENVRVRAIATDQADNSKQVETGDFEVDSIRPQFWAETDTANTVLVHFLEGVLGSTGEDEWRIGDNLVASLAPEKNSDDEIEGITLTTPPIVSIGKNETPLITYEPKDLPIRQEFEDRAGNRLANMSVIALDGIDPALPTVTFPTSPETTAEETFEIEGSAEAGTLVTAYRDTDGDGLGDTAVGSRQLGDSQTRFKISAALVDGPNPMLVQATDPAGNQSGTVGVPLITKDEGAPVLDVLEPEEGAVYAAGTDLTVRWTAVDANLVANPISIDFSTDGGETYESLAEGEANDGEFTFTLPDTDVQEARIQVSALDELGLEASADSGLFRVLVCDIAGTNGDDVITGTPAGEVICSLDGTDRVSGMGGDDIILNGAGNKTIEGGDGKDLIEGGSGNDSLDGGAGNDVVHGRRGDDLIMGGEGIDALFGDLGNDHVMGGAGNDRLAGVDGSDVVEGEAGDDFMSGGLGDDILRGGLGDDRVQGDDGDDQLQGDEGDDTLSGNAGDDRLDGGAGLDTLIGSEGDDYLNGASGADTAIGGPGDDILNGGVGRDSLRGGDEADLLRGANGPDSLWGQADDDTLRGGNGRDLLNGGAGEDSCLGGAGTTTYRRC